MIEGFLIFSQINTYCTLYSSTVRIKIYLSSDVTKRNEKFQFGSVNSQCPYQKSIFGGAIFRFEAFMGHGITQLFGL